VEVTLVGGPFDGLTVEQDELCTELRFRANESTLVEWEDPPTHVYQLTGEGRYEYRGYLGEDR
jgi:hypothetical protein